MVHRTVYLISGQIGSGKTTYAKSLERSTNAVRFTPDEWMLKLYNGIEIPNELFDLYFYRSCELCWSVVKLFIAKSNADIILDFGFWKKSDRDKYKKLLLDLGCNVKLVYLKCPDDITRKKIQQRNKNLPEGCFYISEAMYEFFAPGFEEPLPEENPIVIERI